MFNLRWLLGMGAALAALVAALYTFVPQSYPWPNVRNDTMSIPIINVTKFLRDTNDQPLFTRSLLQNAKDQLTKAERGENITLTDCYGKEHIFRMKEEVKPGEKPRLLYSDYHEMADPHPMGPSRRWPEAEQKRLTKPFRENYAAAVFKYRFPVYVYVDTIKQIPANHPVNVTAEYADFGSWQEWWENSPEWATLKPILQEMRNHPKIHRIVCFALGPPLLKDEMRVQHITAISIAKELSRIYGEIEQSSQKPIEIIAQDPKYLDWDKDLLSRVGIRVVTDPDAFLAIDNATLVISISPNVPIKQIIADIAKDDPEACPRAIYWTHDSEIDEMLGIDIVEYPLGESRYFGDATTPRVVEMLAGFEDLEHSQPLDWEEILEKRRGRYTTARWLAATEWLHGSRFLVRTT